MTFVGKILVIVIMVFALLFLGISTVVFTTNTNWKDATTKERQKVDQARKELATEKDRVAAAQKELEAAQKAHATEVQALNNQLTVLQDQIAKAEHQATEAKNQLGITQRNMQLALDEATAKKAETDQVRVQKNAVEKQANEYKLRQTDLLDKIRELERLLDTAKNNERELRDQRARLTTRLRQLGDSADISQIKGTEAPPPVEGQVKKVDKTNRIVELTIGSDDGLVPGHELFLYRTHPRPEYLAKVRITSVEPDQAVAKVVGKTVNGKKIEEGDHVSTTLRAR